MRALMNSVLATLFVLVLLLVLPLVAVFGIPEFVPIVASSSTEAEAPRRLDPRSVGIGQSATQRASDLFAGFDGGGDDHGDDHGGGEVAEFDTRNVLGAAESAGDPGDDLPLEGWDFDDRGRATRDEFSPTTDGPHRFGEGDHVSVDRPDAARTRPPAYRRPRGEDAADPADPGKLTWSGAIERLRELGIDDFHLTQGSNDQCHFACTYSPRNNSRIVHRFEAEASEPLVAVEKVLDQIGNWSSRER